MSPNSNKGVIYEKIVGKFYNFWRFNKKSINLRMRIK